MVVAVQPIRRREAFPEPAFISEVGSASIDRTTQLLQAFVDTLVGLGGTVVADSGNAVGVKLLGELHGVRLREHLERHREATESGDALVERWRPTGVFELHLEEWPHGELLAKRSDDPHAPLEQQLRDVFASLARQVQATRNRHAATRQAEQETQREKAERERVARDAERARHRAVVLKELAEEHDAYVKVKRMLADCRQDGSSSEGGQEWLRAAEAASETLNVLRGGVDALRDRVEKRIDERMQGWHFYEWGR